MEMEINVIGAQFPSDSVLQFNLKFAVAMGGFDVAREHRKVHLFRFSHNGTPDGVIAQRGAPGHRRFHSPGEAVVHQIGGCQGEQDRDQTPEYSKARDQSPKRQFFVQRFSSGSPALAKSSFQMSPCSVQSGGTVPVNLISSTFSVPWP